MPDQKDHSFRRMNKKEKVTTILGIVLLVLFVIAFIFGMYFFGMAGVFKILGVQYESVWSLVLFVVGILLIGIVIELFTKVFFYLSVRKITEKYLRVIIRLLFEGGSNWLVLFTVDEIMRSVEIPIQTEMIIALFLAVFEILFDDDEKR